MTACNAHQTHHLLVREIPGGFTSAPLFVPLGEQVKSIKEAGNFLRRTSRSERQPMSLMKPRRKPRRAQASSPKDILRTIRRGSMRKQRRPRWSEVPADAVVELALDLEELNIGDSASAETSREEEELCEILQRLVLHDDDDDYDTASETTMVEQSSLDLDFEKDYKDVSFSYMGGLAGIPPSARLPMSPHWSSATIPLMRAYKHPIDAYPFQSFLKCAEKPTLQSLFMPILWDMRKL